MYNNIYISPLLIWESGMFLNIVNEFLLAVSLLHSENA
jgi:hypothetical protein